MMVHALYGVFDMGYLSLEDIYLDDVEKYGHMRVCLCESRYNNEIG